jgi:hypothetical protein
LGATDGGAGMSSQLATVAGDDITFHTQSEPTKEQIDELFASIDGLNAVLSKILIRIERIEERVDAHDVLLSSGVEVTKQRAVLIAEEVRKHGHLKRPDVQKLLDNCHHNMALRVMKEAADMYSDLDLTKTTAKKHWVLRVKA